MAYLSDSYTGQYTGDPIADALLDYPQTVSKAGTSPITYPRQTKLAGFVQDDWRATPRLTFNLGLRYDLDLPINDIILGAFDPAIGGFRFTKRTVENPNWNVIGYYQTVRPDIPITISNTKSVCSADTNNFGPRLGFAYSVGASRKTVVRGGAGTFYRDYARSNPPEGRRI